MSDIVEKLLNGASRRWKDMGDNTHAEVVYVAGLEGGTGGATVPPVLAVIDSAATPKRWVMVTDYSASPATVTFYEFGTTTVGTPTLPVFPDADTSVQVSNFPATQVVSDSGLGTDGPTPPAIAGTGVRGWLRAILEQLASFSRGGGNVDAGTQRVTLAADGPGVGQLTSISTAQTISIGAAPLLAVGATSTQSAVVGAGRNRVVLCPTVDSWIAVGANPTAAKATAGSFYLAAGAQSYPIVVTPGTTRIAVIADGATGFMSIIESA